MPRAKWRRKHQSTDFVAEEKPDKPKPKRSKKAKKSAAASTPPSAATATTTTTTSTSTTATPPTDTNHDGDVHGGDGGDTMAVATTSASASTSAASSSTAAAAADDVELDRAAQEAGIWGPLGIVGTPEFCRTLALKLLDWTRVPSKVHALSLKQVTELLKRGKQLLASQSNVVYSSNEGRYCVIGDVHGQYHDLVGLLGLTGEPSPTNTLVFAGDYVDRGSWGSECLLLLLSWKIAFPNNVILLRGNHETEACCKSYGFAMEIQDKFHAAQLLQSFYKVFENLPLGCIIHNTTMNFSDTINRKLPDHTDGTAAEVLWSDPMETPGMEKNFMRGAGCRFGPDITDKFLELNRLKLILRGHEGPDARLCRPAMPSVDTGYSVDHVTAHGKLATVFSAPDYPQFKDEEDMYYSPKKKGVPPPKTKGAFAVLETPDYSVPRFVSFVVNARPHGKKYGEMT
ncbi:Serine/threonine-protein phosphatase 7 [Pelomyxa schiedti]|nr:Serine/threonine-protein phosphatase 7 [Pelomyxa schiedti]